MMAFMSTACFLLLVAPILEATGKALSETLIFASINPTYDNRLFLELHLQYMKTTRAEHGQFMFLPCSAHVLHL